MGVGRNAPAREVRKKKVRGFLSIPDSGRSVSFSWWDAFQVLAELLPILWLHFPAFRAICLYSFHSEVRKENYFHISNSLNGPKLVAQSLLEPNPLFLHFQIPTWRHCLESGGWLARTFCHAHGQVGGVEPCHPHPSFSINVTTTCRDITLSHSHTPSFISVHQHEQKERIWVVSIKAGEFLRVV